MEHIAGDVRLVQDDADRREVYALATTDAGTRLARGPLHPEDLRSPLFNPYVWTKQSPGWAALARELEPRLGGFHDLTEFYRFYHYPADVVAWVEATSVQPANPAHIYPEGRGLEETARRLGLDPTVLTDAAYADSKIEGLLDPEGGQAFHRFFEGNWAVGDAWETVAVNPDALSFKLWLSFHS